MGGSDRSDYGAAEGDPMLIPGMFGSMLASMVIPGMFGSMVGLAAEPCGCAGEPPGDWQAATASGMVIRAVNTARRTDTGPSPWGR